MDIHEEKVLLSPDRYGRVAIVRRPDAFFWLYQHWHWAPQAQADFHVHLIENRRWTVDGAPDMYEGVEPLPGLYSTVDDAEREARRLLGLDDE